jgi:hypothetical protein
MAPAATAQLVLNGNFSSTSSTLSDNTVYAVGANTLNDWVNEPQLSSTPNYQSTGVGYTFIVTPDASGSTTYNDTKDGPNCSVLFASKALDTAQSTTAYANAPGISAPYSGYSGNILAADGDYENGPLQQTVTGLISGHNYAVTFYYAATQQAGYGGTTTESWSVSLGGGTAQTTPLLSLPGNGNSYKGDMSAWETATFDFTANTTGSEVLSFLAGGSPAGEPPFDLLAGVSMTAIPESSTIVAGLFLLLPVGWHALSKLRRKTSTLQ